MRLYSIRIKFMNAIRSIIFLLLFAAAAFAQTGTITGIVQVNDKTILKGATVSIDRTRQNAQTDETGTYILTNIAPGKYVVRAHIEGFSDETKTVTVTAAGETKVDFQLAIAALTEQVNVTATGSEQSVLESFQSVNSVGSTRIAEKGSTSIGEALEGESGVAKRSFGPGTSRPVIRGFDGDRVLVLQDGVKVGSVGSQSGDHAEPIDPLAAERIEVVKGPGTLLYSSNAIGGIVNVIGHHDDDYHDGFRGYATGIAGTADKQAGFSGGVEYGFKNWLFRGSFGAQRAGDYSTPIGEIPNSASRSNNGSFGTGYYGDKAFAAAAFTTDIRRYGVPFAALFEAERPSQFGEIPNPDEDIDIRQRTYNYKFNGGFRDLTNPFLRGAQFDVNYSNYRHKELEVADGIDNIGTIFDNKVLSFRTLFEQQRYKKLTGRFGVEGFSRDYIVNGEEQLIRGKVDHDSMSAYALEDIDLGRVKFQFGGRLENHRYEPEDPALIGRSFTGFSGGAGINVGLWEGGSAVANYTFSSRAPSLEELYNHGPHIGNVMFEIGDQNLVKETSNGLDLSLRHQLGKFRFRLDGYYYRINNFVFLALQDEDGDGQPDFEHGLPVGRYEQGDAEYFGGEASAEYAFTDHIGAFINLDTVRAKLTNGTDLPRIPPARARVGLDLNYGAFSIRPEAVFAADQKRTFPLETSTAGYGLINVAGSYTLARSHYAHIVSVNAYNLTNRLYRNHLNFVKEFMPEIGRGIRFGYTIRFF